jgi:Tfp pilus assembly protein PilF
MGAYMAAVRKTMGLCLLLSLLGCSVHEVKPVLKQPLPYSNFVATAAAPVPTLSDIFTLTAPQQATFLQYFNHPDQQATAPHERVSKYLSKLVMGFDYQGRNYTASEAFELQQGNCITLAVLTKSLADLAGIDITFQQITSAPVISLQKNWYVSSDHVRTFLHAPQASVDRNTFSFRSFIVVDYFPAGGDVNGERLSESTFIAMYYRNLATDALLAGDHDRAFALLRAGLQHAPDYAPLINLTALLHKEIGQPKMAAQWYQYGLDVSARKTTLLSNYALLKQSEGDNAAATAMLQELEALQERDPYLYYWRGKTALQQQNYRQAVVHFERLVEYAPYVAQFQLELAKAYFYMQRYADARLVLAQAALIAQSPTDQNKYNAKLEALKLHAARD